MSGEPLNSEPESSEPLSDEPLSDEEYSELGKTMGMLFQRIMRSRREPEGGQLAALSMLAKCGPVRSSDLAKELFLDQSTVSRHVAHLEADGLVEKVADPNDGRATQLHLTDLGQKHIHDFWHKRIDAMRDGFEHWDPADLRTLGRLMTRYVEDMASIVAKSQEQAKNDIHTTQLQNGPTTAERTANE
jgi:DNA-binding MarR family transcriptional regulator